jgi:hypothetical protein
MANLLSSTSAGREFGFDYMEIKFLDLLAQYTDAWRSPVTAVLLPGHKESCVPKDLGPQEWAIALGKSFAALVIGLRDIQAFQVHEFHRKSQRPYPKPYTSLSGPEKEKDKTPPAEKDPKGAGKKVKDVTPPPPPPPAGKVKVPGGYCAQDICNHYGSVLKGGKKAEKCPTTCTRVHVKDFPADLLRSKILSTVKYFCMSRIEKEESTKLLKVIEDDKRYK